MGHQSNKISNDATIRSKVESGHHYFWKRLGGQPDFSGKRVLEVGCGLGALSIEMALAGASSVVGADVRERDIRAAREYVNAEVPEIAGRCEFTTSPVSALPRRSFDLVVSRDAFEHIIEAGPMLRQIAGVLRDDGAAYIGFSPLYHSPYGDHDRRRTAFRDFGIFGKLLAAIPWGHLFLESWIIRRHRDIRGVEVDSMHDLNLNMMSIGDFRGYIHEAGLAPQYFGVNLGNSRIGRLFSAVRRIRFLEKYVSYNIYCVLQKRDATTDSDVPVSRE